MEEIIISPDYLMIMVAYYVGATCFWVFVSRVADLAGEQKINAHTGALMIFMAASLMQLIAAIVVAVLATAI